jgi:hypothetical protein
MVVGVGIFVFKHFILGMVLVPDPSARVWRVDFKVAIESEGQPVSLALVQPSSTPRQSILDEETFDAAVNS